MTTEGQSKLRQQCYQEALQLQYQFRTKADQQLSLLTDRQDQTRSQSLPGMPRFVSSTKYVTFIPFPYKFLLLPISSDYIISLISITVIKLPRASILLRIYSTHLFS